MNKVKQCLCIAGASLLISSFGIVGIAFGDEGDNTYDDSVPVSEENTSDNDGEQTEDSGDDAEKPQTNECVHSWSNTKCMECGIVNPDYRKTKYEKSVEKYHKWKAYMPTSVRDKYKTNLVKIKNAKTPNAIAIYVDRNNKYCSGAKELRDYRKLRVEKAKARYYKWNKYMSDSQKKSYKNVVSKMSKSKTKYNVSKYYKHSIKKIKAAKRYQAYYHPTASQIKKQYAKNYLTRSSGVCYYNGHRETYYNLPMNTVCYYAKNSYGIDGFYWVRQDGCKMWGKYIMVASQNYSKGTVVQTSLGKGIVVDWCGVSGTIDIATTW